MKREECHDYDDIITCSGRKNSAPGTPLIEDIEETDYEPDCFRYTSQEYT